jgi:DNA polymerase III delta prime subunit
MEMLVRTMVDEEREKLMEFLENEGFELDKDEFRSREVILDEGLPISIDLEEKKYRMIGNVTCAAAAVTCGVMKTADDFYAEYGGGII